MVTIVYFNIFTNVNRDILMNVTFVKNIKAMEIRERIAKIIAIEGLTSSAFADAVGVQRSNISHILNGRSGPSVELLQKILTSFPKYNTDWLVMGQGDIRRQPVQMSIFDELGESEIPTADIDPAPSITDGINAEPADLSDRGTDNTNAQSYGEIPAASNSDMQNQQLASVLAHATQHPEEVKQVVVLYSDNTFSIYNKK